MMGYIRILFKYTCIVIISCVACYVVSTLVNFPAFGNLVYRAVICCIFPNLIYFMVYRKTVEFSQCIQLIDNMTKNKLRLSRLWQIK